jgi:hypothetical protein
MDAPHAVPARKRSPAPSCSSCTGAPFEPARIVPRARGPAQQGRVMHYAPPCAASAAACEGHSPSEIDVSFVGRTAWQLEF